ncbi:MAG: hypothetical protein KF769_05460 [Parvibaculum sp.]|nr:hypothetical protein [Parvibaculum sp.]
MTVNVPGAAPPGPSEEVFGGGFWGGLLGIIQPVLNSVQQHELAKMNAKAKAAALAAPATYQQVAPGQGAYVAPAPMTIGGYAPETLLMIGGGVLLAIFLLRK